MATSHEIQTPVPQTELASSAESPLHSPEEIALAFNTASRRIYELTNADEFQLSCMDQEIDPDIDMDKPSYWLTLADSSKAEIDRLREKEGNTLELDALELLSATPAHLLIESEVNKNTYREAGTDQWATDKLSGYNKLLQGFATKHPRTWLPSMEKALVHTALNIEDKEIRRNASYMVHNRLRGVQAELGFQQILDEGNHRYRPATRQEDTGKVDIVVMDEGMQALKIDLKASLNEITGSNSGTKIYKRIGPNHIVMFSCTQEADFNKTFFLPDAVAAERAEAVDAVISSAQRPIQPYREGVKV